MRTTWRPTALILGLLLVAPAWGQDSDRVGEYLNSHEALRERQLTQIDRAWPRAQDQAEQPGAGPDWASILRPRQSDESRPAEAPEEAARPTPSVWSSPRRWMPWAFGGLALAALAVFVAVARGGSRDS